MSRLSNSRVRIGIGATAVQGVVEQGWLRRRVAADAQREVDESLASGDPSAESEADPLVRALAPALEAVVADLADAVRLRGATLEVELADALLHLDVVAGEFAALRDRDLQSIATACVAELLGDSASAHTVRWQLHPDGGHLLIAAIPEALLGLLSDMASRHGLKLRSVQPDFCRQWNRHAATLGNTPGVLAVACGPSAIVAHVARGGIVALSHGAWLDSLPVADRRSRHVKRLLCDFGFDHPSTAAALDQRTDRLLASIGVDTAAPGGFVLVAPQLQGLVASPRWTVVPREAVAS